MSAISELGAKKIGSMNALAKCFYPVNKLDERDKMHAAVLLYFCPTALCKTGSRS
jgi:hypothetical protein